MPRLTGKRVLLIGAETDIGRAAATALAEAGATLALVASRSDAEAALAVQRLARKVRAATSQAINASNDAAVRVMVRQVAKALGRFDAIVNCTPDEPIHALVRQYGEREMARTGGGLVLVAETDTDIVAVLAALPPTA